ncbi:hypothetical protein LJR219_004331 [Phenylobacterium sp. LjRoot219]|uniref:hypothetical protein n=1 Tax=Phenylobacterium sp. LjRoot219 TaxID=3342283 RepID=UPI003ECDD304
MRYVLLVENDHALSDALGVVLTRGVSVESASTEMAAYSRLSRFPTIRLVLIEKGFGGGDAAGDVARFARRALPGVSVAWVDTAAGAASQT